MEKLFEINKYKPKDSQLLIRTDLEYKDWFIHFYWKEYIDDEGWRKAETLFKGFYSNDEIEDALDKILEICMDLKEK